MKITKILMLVIFLIVAALPDWAEAIKAKNSPPDWAAAHGLRAKYRYRYYPGSEIYYDVNRKLFFYFAKESWVSAPKLPLLSVPVLGNFIEMDLDTDKPFIHFEVHKLKFPGHKPKPAIKEENEAPIQLKKRWK